jgi:hypothetical protein
MFELPKIPHANVKLNEQGRIEIEMADGWYFYMSNIFGNDISLAEVPKCSKGTFSPNTDFSTLVVFCESEIPEPIPEEVEPETTEPEEVELDENKATETDYINALKELGVSFDE